MSRLKKSKTKGSCFLRLSCPSSGKKDTINISFASDQEDDNMVYCSYGNQRNENVSLLNTDPIHIRFGVLATPDKIPEEEPNDDWEDNFKVTRFKHTEQKQSPTSVQQINDLFPPSSEDENVDFWPPQKKDDFDMDWPPSSEKFETNPVNISMDVSSQKDEELISNHSFFLSSSSLSFMDGPETGKTLQVQVITPTAVSVSSKSMSITEEDASDPHSSQSSLQSELMESVQSIDLKETPSSIHIVDDNDSVHKLSSSSSITLSISEKYEKETPVSQQSSECGIFYKMNSISTQEYIQSRFYGNQGNGKCISPVSSTATSPKQIKISSTKEMEDLFMLNNENVDRIQNKKPLIFVSPASDISVEWSIHSFSDESRGTQGQSGIMLPTRVEMIDSMACVSNLTSDDDDDEKRSTARTLFKNQTKVKLNLLSDESGDESDNMTNQASVKSLFRIDEDEDVSSVTSIFSEIEKENMAGDALNVDKEFKSKDVQDIKECEKGCSPLSIRKLRLQRHKSKRQNKSIDNSEDEDKSSVITPTTLSNSDGDSSSHCSETVDGTIEETGKNQKESISTPISVRKIRLQRHKSKVKESPAPQEAFGASSPGLMWDRYF